MAEVTTRGALRRGRRRRVADRGLRLRDQAHHPAPAGRAGHGRGGAGVDLGRRRSWLASPTACSCRTVPATRPWCRTRSRRSRGLLGQVPIFGICLGHQVLARAIGADDGQAAVRPPRRQPPGAAPGHGSGGDHQPEPQLRRRGRLPRRSGRAHPRQPERRRVRGDARARRRRPSACSTTPRPARAPTTAGTCSIEFVEADGRRAGRVAATRRSGPPGAPGIRPAIRPASQRRTSRLGRRPDAEADRPRVDPDHRLRAHRHRPGLRVRLLGHAGLPGARRRRATG